MPQTTAASRGLALRHVQLLRALVAAFAAVMITFSPDHSAAYGLSIFSGFAFATGVILAAAAWLTYGAGRRWPAVAIATVSIIAGAATGVPALRSIPLFFITVIAWALITGLIEATAGWRERRAAEHRAAARDALTVGIAGIALGVGLLLVPWDYALEYYIDDAQRSFTLTGISIAVGLLGAYAAIIAVYLGIAGFSPRRESATHEAPDIDEPAASVPSPTGEQS